MCRVVLNCFDKDRIGNNLIQIDYAIRYCLHNNVSRIDINRKPKILAHNFISINNSCQCNKVLWTSDFWPRDHNRAQLQFSPQTFDEKRELYKKYVYPQLSFKFKKPQPRALYIHIRESFLNSQEKSAIYYLQPPLAYYKYILNSEKYDVVHVVYQNKKNPCVDGLKKAHPNIHFYSTNGFSDFVKLCEAENLVLGFGTFGQAVCKLSPNVKKVYVPDYVYDKNISNDTCLQYIKVDLPGYITHRKIPNLRSHMISYKIPKNNNNILMRLHLGCGRRFLPGYTHIDIGEHNHIDYKFDIADLSLFETNSIDEIYCSHVLEHFPRAKILNILIEWHRVLKLGGTIRLAVPDFAAIVSRYQQTDSLEDLMGLLYGGQRNEYDYHYMIFDFELLSEFLQTAGFTNIEQYDTNDFLPAGYDDISKAFLPHNNPNGTLMSLNVVATKSDSSVVDPSQRLRYVMGTWRPY